MHLFRISSLEMPNAKERGSLRCAMCRGSGRKDGKVCPVCGGTGELSPEPPAKKK
jgi:DnaJ-class molecular chaperone